MTAPEKEKTKWLLTKFQNGKSSTWSRKVPARSGKFLLIFLVLAALVVGEIYTIYKINSMRDALEAQQTQTSKQLRAEFQDQLTGRLSAIENTNAQQMDALKDELDAASKRVGATGGELKHARAMVAQLQNEQRKQSEQLQAELAQKADQQQVGALNQDVSAQRTDLDKTKTVLDSVRSDLGMARSEMGTLIARNHDDIEQLRKMGERDYFEFTAGAQEPCARGGSRPDPNEDEREATPVQSGVAGR